MILITILAIESSCDDTSAAVIQDGWLLSNVTANQDVHKKYGGVVPELASRAHQANIVPVVDTALKNAGIQISDINAIAFTRGPGLLGSLLVGVSFAKGFALANNIPLIDVNHLHGHIAALFLKEKNIPHIDPQFPFLTLLVSGGHTQIINVTSFFEKKIIGETIDDAAGEAFDKTAKILGLPYPGGPLIDKYAEEGNPNKYTFSRPKVGDTDFSFSGLKTAILYFIRDEVKKNPSFVKENLNDICASVQFTIIDILIEKLKNAVSRTGIKEIAVAGGVSANSGLRNRLRAEADKNGWIVHIPDFKFTTDNAAMIGITAYYKYLKNDFSGQDVTAEARFKED
ncbi:MAG: tRNA (adenosine(37)-N6)-threonylcarbamoyltransferase complex transferase subunit TsaD [Bacteroidetes bacterium]|nr:MAG: tRNA (adenosine(37)-N6)-threonylcarbamoyltransferase complex transferase subunit TsaD [Bacteroidota bacterium]